MPINKSYQDINKLSFSTKTIHAGNPHDSRTGAVVPPIFQTSTYLQENPGDTLSGYDYTRCANPSRSNLAECISSLEGAEYCLLAASGLGSITVATHLLKPNSNVLYVDNLYGGAHRLFHSILSDVHNFRSVDTTDLNKVEAEFKSFNGKVDLIWLETPTNPLLKVTDIAEVVKIAKKHNTLVVVDNTFATPYLQNPLQLGADIVIHSITKYINGHTDVVGGAFLTNNKEIHDRAFFIQKTLGCQLSPFDSWLVSRGVKTLALRMEKHQDNAMDMANFLKGHKSCQEVLYPGLKESPSYEVSLRQCTKHFRGGGIVSFYVDGNLEFAKSFIRNLRFFKLAESLGGVSSLICIPALMTHASVPVDTRQEFGITDNLLRLSVGIEDSEDLIADIGNSLDSL